MNDNVVLLRPMRQAPRQNEDTSLKLMPHHLDWWWVKNQDRFDWQPISLYRPYLDEGMSIASPVLLRDGERWIYGSWVKDGWRRVTEGESWPIADFAPTEWADVDLDAAILLGQE
jgi:hypothetical protein